MAGPEPLGPVRHATTLKRPALPVVLSGWRAWPGHGSVPSMTTTSNPYRGFRYPAEVIQHAVWLYHCFSLSLRDVELILAAHGVVVSYESIRAWGLRFGRLFANALKQRRPKPATSGTSMRCASVSGASSTISGARWIRTGMCWISWCRAGLTQGRQAALPQAAAGSPVSIGLEIGL